MVKVARSRSRAFRLVAVNERGNALGENHPRAKLTEADCELILALWDEGRGLSYAQIASKFDDIPGGVAKSTVRDVCTGVTRGKAPTRFVLRAVSKR